MPPNPLPLRDIHLPEPISWWPPAPGWWLLLVLIPLTGLLLVKLYQYLTRKTVVKTAKKLLVAIQHDPALSNAQKLAELSQLLRRVAISVSVHPEVAGLTGAAWLNFLDSSLSDAPFSHGAGALLADAPYRNTPLSEPELVALFAICERWLANCAKTNIKSNGISS